MSILDVLAGLGHRAVVGGDDQDGAVHLGGAGNHVLDVVGVAGAVDVRVVAVGGLVLDVRGGDGHRLVGVANGAALGDFGVALDLERREFMRLPHHDRRRQRRFAVIDVTDRPHVDVRLDPVKDILSHRTSAVSSTKPLRASGPEIWKP